MKVIFLDIDGVLCTAKAHAAFDGTGIWKHLDPLACRLVSKLSQDASAKIVLSSTWRSHFDKEAMTFILCNGGFPSVDWHQEWRTPGTMNGHRGREIQQWLDKNEVEKYLILDDDTDILVSQQPFFIRTDTFDGLGFKHYIDSRAILGLSS